MKPTRNKFVNQLSKEEAEEARSLIFIMNHYQQEKQVAEGSRKEKIQRLIRTAQKRMERIGRE